MFITYILMYVNVTIYTPVLGKLSDIITQPNKSSNLKTNIYIYIYHIHQILSIHILIPNMTCTCIYSMYYIKNILYCIIILGTNHCVQACTWPWGCTFPSLYLAYYSTLMAVVYCTVY